MMKYIYKIICKPTNKVYIGKTEISVEYRWNQHLKAAFKENNDEYNFPIHRAIRKYGEEAFLIDIIDSTEDSNLLKEKEKYWINYYNSYYDGYNATLGGDGCCKYNYTDIVNLQNDNSIKETCKHFNIYDQVVYSALKSKNIDYKSLKHKHGKKKKKRIFCVELNKIFNSMAEIDEYFNKQVHPNIRRCLNGMTKKAYGYTWREIE